MLSTELKLQYEIEALKRRVRDLERAIAPASLGSIGGGGGMDYDIMLIGGRKYTPATPKTTIFLQIAGDGSSSWVAAMPDVFDPGTEVYDVTKNHIHLPGETAGNL